jgi:hypothetical protein
MSKAKPRKRTKPGKASTAEPLAKPPRNPFAIVVRRRAAGPEASPRAYRRRPKHAKPKAGIESED